MKCKRKSKKTEEEEEDDEGWTNLLIRHCNTCWEEILPNQRYIRCMSKFCRSHSYCLKCVGCPKGHSTNICRVNKHYEGGACLWCQQEVKPNKGYVRLCLECMKPVCYARCMTDVYDVIDEQDAAAAYGDDYDAEGEDE